MRQANEIETIIATDEGNLGFVGEFGSFAQLRWCEVGEIGQHKVERAIDRRKQVALRKHNAASEMGCRVFPGYVQCHPGNI